MSSTDNDEQSVVSAASQYSQLPLSAYHEDHVTSRIFIIGTLSVIAIAILIAFIVIGSNPNNDKVIEVTREIVIAIISGLVGILAGTSMKR